MTPDLAIDQSKPLWPFILTTDAGVVYLTREEVYRLQFLCWAVLHETDISKETVQ